MNRTVTRMWSFAGVAVTYALLVHISYRYALAHQSLPYTLWPRWPAVEVLALLVVTGAIGVVAAKPRALVQHPWLTGLVALLYVVLATGVLLVVQVAVAFANGDSL